MNAQQTSVSAMFDSAFEGLAAPMAAMPQVAGFSAAPPVVPTVPPRKFNMKLVILILAGLGITAAMFLMFKKKSAGVRGNKAKRKQKQDSDDEEEDNSDDEGEDVVMNPKPRKMTTFAPLDMPAVNFPMPPPPGSFPQPQQQPPQTIRNSKGMRASEQLQGFPPPNIDVGLGSGSPPSRQPAASLQPPPATPDLNFNPL